VAFLDVVRIERIQLFAERRADAADLQVGVALEDTLLLAAEFRCIHRDAGRNAGRAALAVGAIQMVPAATKAHLRKLRIHLHVHWLAWIEEQGGGLFVGQVAASVGLGGVELEASQ